MIHFLLNHLRALVLVLFPMIGTVLSGRDAPLDVWGGTLTEVGQSNMPSGGSPNNLNVEFVPGLVRTRGGLQPQASYSSVAGGPWQVRWVDDFATAPESPSQLVLLVNPTTKANGVIATGSTVIGNVYGAGAVQPWSPYAVDAGFGGPLAKGCTQFSRKYITISDGRYGYDIPRQWDGTNFDRVTQEGPGAPPQVSNYTNTLFNTSIGQYSSEISVILEIGNIVYVVPSDQGEIVDGTSLGGNFNGFPGVALQFLNVGDSITIAGVSTAGYNGTWPVTGVIVFAQTTNGPQYAVTYTNPATGLPQVAGSGNLETGLAMLSSGPWSVIPEAGISNVVLSGVTPSGYNGTWPVRYSLNNSQALISVATQALSNASGASAGSMVFPGNITPGLHGFAYCWVTRNGAFTRPSPPAYLNCTGGMVGIICATGPANVKARLILSTILIVPPAVSTGQFLTLQQPVTLGGVTYSSAMLLNDNTSGGITISFRDTDLGSSGQDVSYLFQQIELGECSGVFPYAGRMWYWGELNALQDFYGMEFGGGWSGNTPLGWTLDATYGPGGSKVGSGGEFGDAYLITGNASSTLPGMIEQSAYVNYLGQQTLLQPSTQFGVRITARAGSTNAPTASIVVDAFSPTLGQLAQAVFLGSAMVKTGFGTQILDMNVPLPAFVPADVLIRVYGLQMANGDTFLIDRVRVYPSKEAINYTTLRASRAANPESFDGLTGLIQPTYLNGQAVRAVYQVRDSMYIVTDRQKYVTKNVPGSEPALWTVDPVSASIGTTGPGAVAAGEDWEVFINRYGLYIYIGKEPQKISQEIQSLWNQSGFSNLINWAYGHKVWAAVDLLAKRAYIGAPVNGATECNTIFVMDYQTLDTSEMIAEYPTLRFSVYSGRRIILEQGRKWTMWQFNAPGGGLLPVPYGAFVEQPGMIAKFLLGGADDNNVYLIDPTNRGNDNGQAVESYYTTFFTPNQEQEQMLQFKSHRHLLSFLSMWVFGSGTLTLSAYKNSIANTPQVLPPLNLSNPSWPAGAAADWEKAPDIRAERVAFQFGCNTASETQHLGDWFQMERLCPTVEDDPQAVTRMGV